MTDDQVKAASDRVLARTTETSYCEDPDVLDDFHGPLVDEVYRREVGESDGSP